jgi:hypothetical protein
MKGGRGLPSNLVLLLWRSKLLANDWIPTSRSKPRGDPAKTMFSSAERYRFLGPVTNLDGAAVPKSTLPEPRPATE